MGGRNFVSPDDVKRACRAARTPAQATNRALCRDAR
jgi:hypothetical protein